MAQAALEAMQLVGQNRNRVYGQTGSEVLVPYRLYNLVPHRVGGYVPYGRRAEFGSPQVVVSNISRLIGYDETGIASFSTTTGSTGDLQLFWSTDLINQVHASYSSPSDAVHMDSAGAYITRDAYLVLDREDRRVEPIDVEIIPTAEAGVPAEGQVLDSTVELIDVAFDSTSGIYLVISFFGRTWRSLDFGATWTEVATVPTVSKDRGNGQMVSMTAGGGYFVVSNNNGRVFWSDDNGDTWNEAALYEGSGGDGGGWVSGQVSHQDGTTFWHAADGSHGNIDHGAAMNDPQNENSAGLSFSTDGGANWQVAEWMRETFFIGSETFGADRVGYHPGFDIRLANTKQDANAYYAYSSALGAFSYVETGDNGNVDEWRSTIAGKDRFYVMHATDGRIRQSGKMAAGASEDAVNEWGAAATLDGHLQNMRYNSVKETIVVCGSNGDEPRIWQGGDATSLAREQEIEQLISDLAEGIWVGTVRCHSAAFDDNGGAVYVATAGIVITATGAPGLQAGTYDLFFASYFNTKAGRFVFDLYQESLSFNTSSSGNEILIDAQTKESIISSNPWLAALSTAEAEAIVDDLRLDVYIQFSPLVGDTEEEDISFSEATAEYTIRYAFTVPFPDDDGSGDTVQAVGRTIGELPIGRQMVVHGSPTTVVFEKSRIQASDPIRSRTAIHNGRIWGLAAQDEDRWAQGDNISLEIANQFNRFVLTYTETGWANMISDSSYIPIQPTQSRNFTGLLSTPSGLMVMFDNEIFLVDGDPAFGNVSVQLYLDMVGCDVGTVPAKMGGIPFTIWDGKIWALQAGQASEIAQGQWRHDDPFIRIAPEPQTRSLLALTEAGRVLRFLVDDQFWMTDAVNRDSFALAEMIPNCLCGTGDNTRFVEATGEVWSTRVDGTPDTPHIVYRDVDFGAPERRTPLYVAKLTFEGDWVTDTYDRTAVGYDAALLPAMFYSAASSSNGDTHETISAQAGGIAPVRRDVGSRKVATVSFRAPLRSTRSFSMDLRFELRGMGYDDVMKAPLRLYHAAGGELR